MRTITDTAGREWTVSLTVAGLRRVMDLAQVDLARVVEPQSTLLFDLYARPAVIGAVLWALVSPQAQARQITRADFEEALSGHALSAGKAVLLDEVADFFGSFLPGEAELIRRWRGLMDTAAAAMVADAAARMADATAASVLQPQRQTSGIRSGDAPGSAA